MKTPSLKIDQNLDSRIEDKYYGRLPKILYAVYEADICEVNPEFIYLMHGYINGTIGKKNMSIELYREVLDVIRDMTIDPMDRSPENNAVINAFNGGEGCGKPYGYCLGYQPHNGHGACIDFNVSICNAYGSYELCGESLSMSYSLLSCPGSKIPINDIARDPYKVGYEGEETPCAGFNVFDGEVSPLTFNVCGLDYTISSSPLSCPGSEYPIIDLVKYSYETGYTGEPTPCVGYNVFDGITTPLVYNVCGLDYTMSSSPQSCPGSEYPCDDTYEPGYQCDPDYDCPPCILIGFLDPCGTHYSITMDCCDLYMSLTPRSCTGPTVDAELEDGEYTLSLARK
jgi:hypothetical protein